MTLLQDATTRMLDLFTELKKCAVEHDIDRFNKHVIEMDAIIEHLFSQMDKEFQCNHHLRSRAAELGSRLEACRSFVSRDSGLSPDSNIEALEKHIIDTVQNVPLFEYEMRKQRPESPLLKLNLQDVE